MVSSNLSVRQYLDTMFCHQECVLPLCTGLLIIISQVAYYAVVKLLAVLLDGVVNVYAETTRIAVNTTPFA